MSSGLATAVSQALLLQVLNLSELFCHGSCVNKEKKFIHNILKRLVGSKVQYDAQCNMIFMILITVTLEPINSDEEDTRINAWIGVSINMNPFFRRSSLISEHS